VQTPYVRQVVEHQCCDPEEYVKWAVSVVWYYIRQLVQAPAGGTGYNGPRCCAVLHLAQGLNFDYKNKEIPQILARICCMRTLWFDAK
jgi:hypothetical protein